jgi:hypothetical protein
LAIIYFAAVLIGRAKFILGTQRQLFGVCVLYLWPKCLEYAGQNSIRQQDIVTMFVTSLKIIQKLLKLFCTFLRIFCWLLQEIQFLFPKMDWTICFWPRNVFGCKLDSNNNDYQNTGMMVNVSGVDGVMTYLLET